MRLLALLTLFVCLAKSAPAQTAPANCGAPDVVSAASASLRFASLVVPITTPVRDTYESTAEWRARADRSRADAQRAAMTAFGDRRTLRVGGPAAVRYDADAERLILGETPPEIAFPDIPYSIAKTKVYRSEVRSVARSLPNLWGGSQTGRPLSLDSPYPYVGLSRAQARTLDVANNATCFFVVYRVFGANVPVIGFDRVEIVSVVRGQPYVWSWSLGDDGTEGSPLPPPAPPPPAPPPPAPPPPPPAGPLDFAEVQPEIIGDIETLLVYPDFERRAGAEGRVIVRFVVSPEGVPSQIEVVRRVSPGFDQAAVQAVQRARFRPGQQNGHPVAVRFTLPVTFSIR